MLPESADSTYRLAKSSVEALVARLRVERAKDLLATGEEPTTEIAFRPVNTGISAAGPRTVEHLPGNFQIVGGNSA
jgi:hypothetical protein